MAFACSLTCSDALDNWFLDPHLECHASEDSSRSWLKIGNFLSLFIEEILFNYWKYEELCWRVSTWRCEAITLGKQNSLWLPIIILQRYRWNLELCLHLIFKALTLRLRGVFGESRRRLMTKNTQKSQQSHYGMLFNLANKRFHSEVWFLSQILFCVGVRNKTWKFCWR